MSSTPANALLAAGTGPFTSLCCKNLWVAGVGFAPAQVAMQVPGEHGPVFIGEALCGRGMRGRADSRCRCEPHRSRRWSMPAPKSLEWVPAELGGVAGRCLWRGASNMVTEPDDGPGHPDPTTGDTSPRPRRVPPSLSTTPNVRAVNPPASTAMSGTLPKSA